MDIIKLTEQKIEEILNKLSIQAKLDLESKQNDEGKNFIQVNITGEDISELIGFHGKNIDSLQVIVNLLLGKELSENETMVVVDVNNYKEDRMNYVRNIATRAIVEVKETKQSMELVPMKPQERRIVHIAVKEDGEVESESIGEAEDRRVIIKLKV